MNRLWRAFIAAGIAWLFSGLYFDRLVDWLSSPLVAKLRQGQKLIAATVTATFTAPLKLSLMVGLIIAMPGRHSADRAGTG